MSWYDPRDWWAPSDRSDSGRIGDIPILGDIHKGIFGDPDSIKEAYDKQIEASKESQAKMQQFLMGAKQQAQGFYAPIQAMFNRTYGSQPGIAAPQTPGVPNSGRLSNMYNGTR